MQYETERRYYIIALILLSVFSTTFLLMPIPAHISSKYSKILLFIIGSIFWGSGIVGYLLLFKVHKAERQKVHQERKQRLFSNVLTTVADTCFLVGVAVLAIIIFLKQTNGYMVYFNLFIIVISFNAHWLFSRELYNIVLKRVQ